MLELWLRPLPLTVLLLVVLGLLVWLPQRVVSARGMTLLRCLVPSWRFFEQIEPVPALHYRFAPSADGRSDDWGDWQDALTVPARPLSSLFLNAAGNLYLAEQSLIEHLVADLDDASSRGEPQHELITYRLVCALIERRLRGTLPPSHVRYQFRLADPDGGRAPLYLSGVHASS